MRAPSPPTKNLLTITAVIEAGTGLGLVASPSLVVTLLLGSSLDAPVPLTIARLAGSAILALGVACWLGRWDRQTRAAKELVGSMMFYNAAVATVLLYSGIGLGRLDSEARQPGDSRD